MKDCALACPCCVSGETLLWSVTVPHDGADMTLLRVRPLGQRQSKHKLREILLDPDGPPPEAGAMAASIASVADRMRAARAAGAAVILAYGAHLVKNGLAPIVRRLLEGGWLTHLATNGAGVIHDWEYAFLGRSEEDVRANVATGQFGAWDETGRCTQVAVLVGSLAGMGYGESVGRFILDDGCLIQDRADLSGALRDWSTEPSDDESMPATAELLQTLMRFGIPSGFFRVEHPFKDASLTAAAARLDVPLTVHPGIGYDIVYNHPMANGAALGRAAGRDYAVLVDSVDRLGDAGVVLSVGSAVMAPQVLEKAVAAANNIRSQRQLGPLAPYIAVNDLVPTAWDWSRGEPPVDDPAYYMRFCKSFSRLGGEMAYIGADNRAFLHNLCRVLGEE